MNKSKIRNRQPGQDPFKEVGERLNEWRARRKRGSRIPKEFWEAAVQLAKVHGISPTAKVLRLDYKDLQRRVGESCQGERDGGSIINPKFIELPMGMGDLNAGQGASVEITRPKGQRLYLSLGQLDSNQLGSVIEAFMRV